MASQGNEQAQQGNVQPQQDNIVPQQGVDQPQHGQVVFTERPEEAQQPQQGQINPANKPVGSRRPRDGKTTTVRTSKRWSNPFSDTNRFSNRFSNPFSDKNRLSTNATGANRLSTNYSAPNPDDVEAPNRATLVPQPTDSPRDPLNWSRGKKHLLFTIMCLATFTGTCVATSPLLASTVQAKTFGVTPTDVSYTISGTIAGIALGPLLIVPIAEIVGLCSASFWSLVITAAFCAWAAAASRGPNDLLSYGVARGLVGLFCQMPQILTGGLIINLYFLHERGKFFAIYSTLFSLGNVVGASFVGVIIQHQNWDIGLWWLVAANGLSAVLVFSFMEETGFDRDHYSKEGEEAAIGPQQSWFARRVALFFPGTKVVKRREGFPKVHKLITRSFVIAVCPVSILIGTYSMLGFAFLIIVVVDLSIILQEPFLPEKGYFGYGFDGQQSGLFLISAWIGILFAQAYGIAFNDRLPLAISRRNNGKWHPEYRLYPAWFTGLIIMPVGLGIVGATLQYHLHFMVLALGVCLVSMGGVSAVPIPINYLAECFRHYPQEVGAALNFYRLIFALALPFFITAWTEKVGVGWVFGMQAFFSILAYLCVLLLMWKGRAIRKWSFIKHEEDEEGEGGMPQLSAAH